MTLSQEDTDRSPRATSPDSERHRGNSRHGPPVAAEKVAPRANEIDATAEDPGDMFELLRKLGLFTLPFPAEYGGSGSMMSAAVAVEELGRVCYNTGKGDIQGKGDIPLLSGKLRHEG